MNLSIVPFETALILLLLGVYGLLIFYVLLRYRFLDLVPISLSELLASMPDGLVVLNQRGVVTLANDSAPELLGAALRDLVGRSLLGIIEGSPLELDVRAMLISAGGPATSRIVYESPAGSRAVELRLRPLRVHGFRVGSLLIVRDRTDRAAVEQSLEQRLSELTAISHLARTANAARRTDDLVRAITRELVRVLPRDRVVIGLLQPDGAALRLVVDEALHPVSTLEGQDVKGNDLELLSNILRGGVARAIHISDVLLAGTAAQAILQHAGLRTVLIVPLSSQSEPLGAMFVGHAGDYSLMPDEVRLFETVGELVAEAAVRARLYEQAREASRAKSTFLATVSHELRTPLTSIIGYTDMIERGLFGALPERAREPLANLRRNGQMLLRLINDLLDFSKMEAGHLKVDLAPVELPPVIRAVVGALRPQVQERGLDLKVEIAPELPRVSANGERLEQVLTNLIANAIKFTDQGSITVRAERSADRVRFSVTDTGIGIARDEQHRLFQEFQRVESGATGRYPGTGLGLAISQRLMRLMGGALTVESTPGVGSTFSGELASVPESLAERERGGQPT